MGAAPTARALRERCSAVELEAQSDKGLTTLPHTVAPFPVQRSSTGSCGRWRSRRESNPHVVVLETTPRPPGFWSMRPVSWANRTVGNAVVGRSGSYRRVLRLVVPRVP